MSDELLKALDGKADLTLEHMRNMRADITAINAKLTDHDKRFSLIERQLAGIRGDIAIFQEMHVDHGDKFRAIESRLNRLERQAGLSEALQQ